MINSVGVGKTNSAIITGSGTGGDLIQALNKLDSTDSGRKVLLKRYGSTEATEYHTYSVSTSSNTYYQMAFFGNSTFRDYCSSGAKNWQYEYKNGAFESVTTSIAQATLYANASTERCAPQYDPNDPNVTIMNAIQTENGFKFVYDGVAGLSKTDAGWFYVGKKDDKYYIGYFYASSTTSASFQIYEYDVETSTLTDTATWESTITISKGTIKNPRGWWVDDKTIRVMAKYLPSSTTYTTIFMDYNVETGEYNTVYRPATSDNVYPVGGFDDLGVICNNSNYNERKYFDTAYSFKLYRYKDGVLKELDLLKKYTGLYRVWVNNAAKQIIVCTSTNIDVYEYDNGTFTPKSYKFELPENESTTEYTRFAISSQDGRLFAIMSRTNTTVTGTTLAAITDIDKYFTAIEDSVKEYDYLTFTGITTGNTSGDYVEVKTVMPDTVTIDVTITPDPDEVESQGEK